jgi:hypothetical protein
MPSNRLSRLGLLLLAVLFHDAPATADSWMPPGAQLASSLDGGWYAIVNPTEKWSAASFLLVRRAAGASRREAPGRIESGVALGPDAGDGVVARGPCKVPMRVLCLDAGRGFVLFDTYASVGSGTVLERYDGKGRRVWSRRLADLFRAEAVEAFSHSVSSIWWSRGIWVDETSGDLVILHAARGASAPSVLRVSFVDGKHKPGRAEDVLARIGRGHAEEQILALEAAEQLGLEARFARARAALADPATPLEARVRFAMVFHARGDPSGTPLVVAAAQAGSAPRLRAYALRQLPALIGVEALPMLEPAMRSEDDEVWAAAEWAFRALGARAVPTLVRMAQDETATGKYRLGAVHALWNMQGEAMDALPVLERLEKTAPTPIAEAAGHAVKALRKLKAAAGR